MQVGVLPVGAALAYRDWRRRFRILTGLALLVVPGLSFGLTCDLRHAVLNGDLRTIQVQLTEGCEPNAKANRSFTALRATAAYGHKGMAEFLIEAGADPNASSKNGVTPWASHTGSVSKNATLWSYLTSSSKRQTVYR